MDKWQKIADYIMSSKCDKWAFIILTFFYLYIIAQIVRWAFC